MDTFLITPNLTVNRTLVRDTKIPNVELMLIPCHVDQNHWVLVAVYIFEKIIIYMNTLGVHGKEDHHTKTILDNVTAWLTENAEEARDWKREINPDFMPLQHDGSSCGVLILYVGECLAQGVRPNITQHHISILRKRAALYLSRGKVPDCGLNPFASVHKEA